MQALRIQRKIQEEGGVGPSETRASLSLIGPLPTSSQPANRQATVPVSSLLGVSLPSAGRVFGGSSSQGGLPRNQPLPGPGIGALPSLFPRQQPTGLTLAVDEEFSATRRGMPSSSVAPIGLPMPSLVRPPQPTSHCDHPF